MGETKRGGPKVLLVLSCGGCMYLTYGRGSDDPITCARVEPPRVIRDTVRQIAPDWCPLRDVAIAEAARVR